MRISHGHRLLTSTSCVHADIFQIQKVHHSILYLHVTSDAIARPSLKAPARARLRGLVAPPNRKPKALKGGPAWLESPSLGLGQGLLSDS